MRCAAQTACTFDHRNRPSSDVQVYHSIDGRSIDHDGCVSSACSRAERDRVQGMGFIPGTASAAFSRQGTGAVCVYAAEGIQRRIQIRKDKERNRQGSHMLYPAADIICIAEEHSEQLKNILFGKILGELFPV